MANPGMLGTCKWVDRHNMTVLLKLAFNPSQPAQINSNFQEKQIMRREEILETTDFINYLKNRLTVEEAISNLNKKIFQ